MSAWRHKVVVYSSLLSSSDTQQMTLYKHALPEVELRLVGGGVLQEGDGQGTRAQDPPRHAQERSQGHARTSTGWPPFFFLSLHLIIIFGHSVDIV